MKRLLAITLSALLLCPMTSYAAQTDDARAVYEALMANSQAATDLNAYYDLNMTMSGSVFESLGTDPIAMHIEMNTKMNHLTEPDNMRLAMFPNSTASPPSLV